MGYTFHVLADAPKKNGIRQTFSPQELAVFCRETCSLPLTAYLLDLRYHQADFHNLPQPKRYPKGLGMNTPEAVREHSERIDQDIMHCRKQFKSIGNVGKHWVWPLEQERLYGWHIYTDAFNWKGIPLYSAISGIPKLKVIQRMSEHMRVLTIW
jgi:hypothetical protein